MADNISRLKYNLNELYKNIRRAGNAHKDGKNNHKESLELVFYYMGDVVIYLNEVIDELDKAQHENKVLKTQMKMLMTEGRHDES